MIRECRLIQVRYVDVDLPVAAVSIQRGQNLRIPWRIAFSFP